MDESRLIIESRKNLIRDLSVNGRKGEAEGGCGVLGVACSVPIKGKYLLDALFQMRNRGNGKGGGIAAVGLSPEQLGVSKEILEEDYIVQIACLDSSARSEVEAEFLLPFLEIHHAEKVSTVDDYRWIEDLAVEPPEVWRYFCRAREGTLEEFRRKNGLQSLEKRKVEDEFIYQNSFHLNKKFYSSLGEKRAFVISHGRNMIVLKIVGYAEQVIKYYRLEDLEASLWIGHHRYPTKGRVWHPGGAHPFVGLNEALVHNGDFANYHSICEYLKQRNIYPLFLTDTEVAALLFDLLNRVYEYPVEYLLEALAPTTERDFEMLPEEKKTIYRLIQSSHMHGSPDGPWFFIVARNDPLKNQFQLLGITDTSMLRPQVFALQEGKVQIGLIASERQAIDAMLRSLEEKDERFWSPADRYWNARGGSYTDGGAFIFTVHQNKNGNSHLVCTDKFGNRIEISKDKTSFRLQNPIAISTNVVQKFPSPPDARSVSQVFDHLKVAIPEMSFEEFWRLCHSYIESAKSQDDLKTPTIELLTLLMDRIYDSGHKKKSCIFRMLEYALVRIFDSIPPLEKRAGTGHVRVSWKNRNFMREPGQEEKFLLIDAEEFPPEGRESLASFMVSACKKGWRNLILYDLRGQRFCCCGLGAQTHGVTIHIYGNSGDYLASGMDGAECYVHGSAQDQVGNIMKSGKLAIHGDVGQTFMYGAKGGEVYVLGNAAGRPLINAVGKPKVVINGTCLDYLAESFMAGDPFKGGGFAIVNGITFDEKGKIVELETPYPGGNLFSLASGGALYMRDPRMKVSEDQLNGGRFSPMTDEDCLLIRPFLEENERLFGITLKDLSNVDNRIEDIKNVYRKIEPAKVAALAKYSGDVG